MKLSKKVGVVVGSLVATFALGCCAWAADVEQTAATSSSAKVTWSNPSNQQKCTVYYSETADFSNATEVAKDVKSNNKNITGLTPGMSAYVKVKIGDTYTDPIEIVTTPKVSNDNKIYQTGAGVGTATIKWDAVDGANGYDVYLGNAYSNTVTTNFATVKIASDISVKVRVFRKSSTGFKAEADKNIYLNGLSHIRPLPGKVTTAKFAMSTASNICVDWEPVKDAQGYELQYCNYNGKKVVTKDCGSSTLGYISNPKRIFYNAKVRAYIKIDGKKLYGAWSDKFGTAIDLTYGFDGTKVANASTRKQLKVKLSWMRVKGATKYAIYMSMTNGAGFKKIKTTKKRNLVISKFRKKKLKSGKKYYFKVVAVRKDGKTSYTSVKDATRYLTVIKLGKK